MKIYKIFGIILILLSLTVFANALPCSFCRPVLVNTSYASKLTIDFCSPVNICDIYPNIPRCSNLTICDLYPNLIQCRSNEIDCDSCCPKCPKVNPCLENTAPIFQSIPNKTINYTQNLTLNLYDYISDLDTSKSTLYIEMSSTGINCNLDKYDLICEPTNIGIATVDLNVVDPCGAKAQKQFEIEVTNDVPIFNLPNKILKCNAETLVFENIINLKNHVIDEEKELIVFDLISQTNNNINCYIENNYLSCELNECSNTSTTIIIDAIDIFDSNKLSQTIISVEPQLPKWEPIIDCFDGNLPVTCLNEAQNKILDLRDYLDTNNAVFTLDQNSTIMNCFIEENNYISCVDIPNTQITNILEVTATNQWGSSTTYMQIKTNCNSLYQFKSEEKEICLGNCTTHTVPIYLKNESFEKQCFDFELDHKNYLNANLTNNKFCLNKNESTTFYLNIITCGADRDNYNLEVYDYEKDLSINFDLSIGSCNHGDFRIDEYDGQICSGETKTFNVEVFNRTNENKTIELKADNYMLLPYFKKDILYLEDNEKKFSELTINARGATPGKYNILLSGNSTNFHIEKRMVLEVVDCSNLKETNFIIKTPPICYDVSKGQTFNGSFTVKRTNVICPSCNFNTKDIALSTTGFTTELSKSYLSLEANEEQKINYQIQVPKTAKAGNHFIEIIGIEQEESPFDDEIGQVQPKEICLNVLGTSKSNILLETKTKNIPWCSSEIFELIVFNNGDFTETLDLSIENLPIGVNAILSEPQIILESGEKKTIYVSVSTSPESEIKNNQKIIIRLTNGEEINFTTKIYFNIIKKIEFKNIEILYSNELILTKANTTTQYELMLRNNTERTFYNVKISAENMPNDTNFEDQIISEIAPGQVIVVGGNISIGDINGYFTPSFVIEKDVVLNKKVFGLSIEKEEEGFFAGLFAFGIAETSILLSLFLILLVLLIILALTNSSTKNYNKEEEWVKNK